MTMRSSLRPGYWRPDAWRLGGLMLIALVLAAATATGQETGKRNLELADYLSWETVGDPRISPDGASVVYERRFVDPVGDRIRTELWIVGADGSRNRFLTAGSGARWSPDGTRIAFTRSVEPHGSQIFVRWMDAEGAESPDHPAGEPALADPVGARQQLARLPRGRASGAGCGVGR